MPLTDRKQCLSTGVRFCFCRSTLPLFFRFSGQSLASWAKYLPTGRPGGAVSQYPEFGPSYQSIQDALTGVVQTEAGTARSSNTKGLFMELLAHSEACRV